VRFVASPLARRLAKEHRLDLAVIKGSGPNGRIVERDIQSALAKPPKATGQVLPDPRLFYEEGSYTEIALSAMQRAIGKKLTQSIQEIPHYEVAMKYDMSDVIALRFAEQEAGWNSTYPSSNNPKATTQYKESVRETCWEL